ncbi:MAG: flagellar export chaperone FliS [Deltaproteobacteria bacterium]|nr:flagellar export chaperone FliS [Deltaproteobacteria bacterium]
MYGSGSGIDMYKRANVTTADPLRLVLMCYEGAIRNLRIAREKDASKDYEAKAKALQKVQDALSLLTQSLDFEKGGAIAGRLNSLYVYMARRIVEGDLQRDVTAFDEVTSMLEELESGWKEIDSARRDPSCHREERANIAGAY